MVDGYTATGNGKKSQFVPAIRHNRPLSDGSVTAPSSQQSSDQGRWKIGATLLLLVAAPLVLGAAVSAAKIPTLEAIRVDQVPFLDGVVSEPFWKDAPVLTVQTEGEGDLGAQNAST